MFFCLDRDIDFFNYCLSKINIPFIRSDSVNGAVFLIHTEWPRDEVWAKQVEDLIPLAQHAVLVTTEVHPYIVDWIQSKIDSMGNCTFYTCGWIPNLKSKQYTFMDWFATTAYFYKNRRHLLEKAEKTDTSTIRFNALLGRKKPHRDIAYNFLKDRTDTVCTYLQTKMGTIDPDSFKDPTKFIWESEQQPVEWTVDSVRYDGELVSLSQIIPLSIYADTDWCIVAETNYQREFVFFTEKTAKPILAKKPFIIIGNPNSLDLLHRLGFKTFNGLIDESYDLELNFYNRMDMALSQVDYLSTLSETDRFTLNEKIQPIVTYNQNLMLETDWQIFEDFRYGVCV